MPGVVQIDAAQALDAADCRRLILSSEPWITLGYDETNVQAIVRSAASEHLLLARADGRVIGFALSSPGILLGEYLRILVVDPAHHALGVGRALMAELERRAFHIWPNVYLCVSDFNPGARAFYRRIGYQEVGALRDLLIAGKDEILMRKTIAAWRAFRPAAP